MEPDFEPWYVPGEALYRCGRCGAVVADTNLHADWHALLTSHAVQSIGHALGVVL